MNKTFWRSIFLASAVTVISCAVARGDLLGYVRKPDKAFTWELRGKFPKPQGTLYEIQMTSQKWHEITWEHRIQVFQPARVETPGAMLLLITGGDANESQTSLGYMLANAIGIPIAVLYQIPNQPLFGGKSEDALIALTFEEFLKSGDESWPLLFPMTKSAVRAMDVLQALALRQGMKPITRFIVTGASKRGWTTWLTAAVDGRVKGIAPMVYDNLNLAAQMPHQIESWGSYSEQIADYTQRGVQDQLNTPRGKRLAEMVDPYTYRKSLTMPKLIINGTNDPYWTQDALNLYWDKLAGPRWVVYSPNSGHGLENRQPVLEAMVAFARAVAAGKRLPEPRWEYQATANGVQLTVEAKPAKSATLWTAHSATRDFRKSRWEATPMQATANGFAAEVAHPATGYVAVFAQIATDAYGLTFPTSTQIKILGR